MAKKMKRSALASINKKLKKERKRLDFLAARLKNSMGANHAKAVRWQLNKVWALEERRFPHLPKG
jgi:hypothetical protein